MLYLAEVLRKARVIGGGRAELKLIACQRSELSWSAVPGEEIVPAPDDLSYGAGALVMVELSAGKQVQRYSEAGRQLVTILQNFSRFHEKAKTQEEEIEQWKQSLTYQSQELNRREMEIEAAQEQLQHIEEDFQRLEQQRQEIEAAQAEVNQLRAEYERKSQELEGAWAQVQGEACRLEERQSELLQMTVLDEEQAARFRDLLDRVTAAVVPTESIQTQLNQTFEVINHQQDALNEHWQILDQQRSSAQQLQTEVDQQVQTFQAQWTAWQQAQTALEQVRIDLEVKQNQLQLKREQAQVLTSQIQTQASLYQELAQLADGTDRSALQGLEEMPLETLQSTVADLEKDLGKMSQFVSSQEEELVLQQQTIDDLRHQIQQASEYDRLRLETELADEEDRYQMLNQTLVGQRRNLQDRETILKQHQMVLAKRQGYPLPNNEAKTIDVEPVLVKIDHVQQQLSQQLQALEQEIQQLQGAIEAAKSTSDQQIAAQTTQWSELQQVNDQIRAQIASVSELWGKINLYQDFLQPVQDNLNHLKQNAEEVAATIHQMQEVNTSQHHAVSELREVVEQLTSNAPVAELTAT